MTGKRVMLLPFVIFCFILAVPSYGNEISLTVYPRGLVLVRDLRAVNIEKGRTEIPLEDIPATVEPGSILVNPRSGAQLRIIEKTYSPATMGIEKLLGKYIGQMLSFSQRARKF